MHLVRCGSAIRQEQDLGAAMALCVIPFIPGDLIKIAIAAVVAPTVANQIKRI